MGEVRVVALEHERLEPGVIAGFAQLSASLVARIELIVTELVALGTGVIRLRETFLAIDGVRFIGTDAHRDPVIVQHAVTARMVRGLGGGRTVESLGGQVTDVAGCGKARYGPEQPSSHGVPATSQPDRNARGMQRRRRATRCDSTHIGD